MSENIGTGKSKKGFSIILTVVIGAAVLAGVVGVLMVVNNTPADLTEDPTSNSVTENTDSGTQGKATASNNLPQYPGSQITDSTTSAEGSSLDMEMESNTDANALGDTVMTYYKQELPKLGWKIGIREDPSADISGDLGLLDFYNDNYDGFLGVIVLSDTKIQISIITVAAGILD